MTNAERNNVIEFLINKQSEYVDGDGYDARPKSEYYAIDTVISILSSAEVEE